MPEIRGDSESKLAMAGIITIHLRRGESRTRVLFWAVDKIFVPVLLGTAFIDNFMRLSQPAEMKNISHYS